MSDSNQQAAPGWGEDDVARWLAARAASSSAHAAWLLDAVLPPAHPLREGFERWTPRATSALVEDHGERLDLVLEGEGWSLLVCVVVRVQRPLTGAHRFEVDAWARAAVADGRVTGALAVLVAPRRYARDRGLDTFDALVTLESLAEWALPDDPVASAALRETCEEAVRAGERARRRASDAHWHGYDLAAAELGAHLTMLPRTGELERAREVLFGVPGGARVGRMPRARLRHRLEAKEARLELHDLPAPPEPLARVIALDAPLDLRVRAAPGEVHLALPCPPVDQAIPTERQRHDIRHGLLALWRLRAWYSASARRWEDWITQAGSPGPAR